MREEAVTFGTASRMVGIATEPVENAESKELPAVIILNAGLMHRVGPNRLYVNLARRLASQGFTALRFDLSGIGDSGPRSDNLPVERSSISETQEAMDYLSATRGVRRFVLAGICSGAGIAYKTALEDTRVVGTALVNPRSFGTSAASADSQRSLTRYYWRIGSSNRRGWFKAATGRARYGRIIGALLSPVLRVVSARVPPDDVAGGVGEGLRSLVGRGVGVFVICSEWDWSLEFLQLAVGKDGGDLAAREDFRLEFVKGADHLFTPLWSQRLLLELTENWATGLPGPHKVPATPA